MASEATGGAETLRVELNRILARLRTETKASRTTVRLDLPRYGFGVDDPAGESLDDGIKPLTGVTSIDQWALDTVQWLVKHHKVLVQPFCRGADPAPPDALIDIYGVQAQMLAPIILKGTVVGWISVHENRTTRDWTEAEVAAISRAAEEMTELLARDW